MSSYGVQVNRKETYLINVLKSIRPKVYSTEIAGYDHQNIVYLLL